MTRADALDREAFEDMLRSKVFGLLRERLQQALKQVVTRCEAEESELHLRRAQGEAKALRMALALPDQILQEMKGRK